ncbi:MAG: exopolysaccharide biosynthesis polyprenyl glycosylphosphotransferase [Fervidobacterium sp.]
MNLNLLIYAVDYTFVFILTQIFNMPTLLSIVIPALILLLSYAFRAYDLENLECFNNQIVRLLISSFLSFLLLPLILEMFHLNIPKKTISYVFLIAPLLLSPMNTLLIKITRKTIKPKKYLVIGKENEVKDILDEITQKSMGKYLFEEFINPSPVKFREKVTHYDNVLVADYYLYENIKDEIQKDIEGKYIEYLSELSEKVLRRIPISVALKFKEYYEVELGKIKESPAKRVLDVIGAFVGLILFLPFMLIATIGILIEDGKPVVFKQLRVGKKNKEFLMLKFRSMRNIEADGEAKFVDDEKYRILKIGKFIRLTRIDETLQFINVLKGDMSLVGPRPEQISFVRMFEREIPFYPYRHNVKPGITGWAQIMYKYSSSTEETVEKLSYDLYYVKNRNIFMDLQIILQTLETMFLARGAK